MNVKNCKTFQKFLMLTATLMIMIQVSNAYAAQSLCNLIPRDSAKDVVWGDMVGVTVASNRLTKVATEGWNSAAFSTQFIMGDGAVEFVAAGDTESRMLGLSITNEGERFEGINYAVFLTSYGRLYVFEEGIQRGEFTAYDDSDLIRIERIEGNISYLKNDKLIYQSQVQSLEKLYVDISMYTQGGVFENAKIYGTDTITAEVDWTELVNTTTEQHKLIKQGGKGWQGGAASAQYIAGDGAVEFTVDDTSHTLAFGLSRTNKDPHYKKIDYAIFISAKGRIYIYEKGFSRGSFGKYDEQDVLRIERTGSRIDYKRNCETFYTSKRKSRGKLISDVSLYSASAAISNAMIYGAAL